ncbi:site-specific DNA-methyltransferase, partial [Candidatus Woesearchaeota archaeon]|nr:site-specific DNA-methyltransferase [Candidatus Woesearchaeota archaeon]
HLKLSDAETESNNNKATSDKERRFVILESNPCEVINDELYINFEYKAIGKEKQDKLNEQAISKALESIEDIDFIGALNTDDTKFTGKGSRTLFEKHLKSYTSRNSFDYFIHKDLGGFLNRELDFYIKNEMLFLDDIMDSPIKYEEVMAKVKIFKEVVSKIIAFLTQLEELQKKLWEKKKFIIETNYCITLDKIDEDYYEQILACKEQLAEWKSLFDVDVQSIDDLKEEKYLLLDTKFFDMRFKYALLAEFDNLDEELDGVIINSENFGALNLLQDRYKEQIQAIYIDPPYNTNSSEILYKNNYKHSSWISLVENRILLGSNLLNSNGIQCSTIDDAEFKSLWSVLDLVYTRDNFLGVAAIRINPGGRKSKRKLALQHEYAIFYSKDNETKVHKIKVNPEDKTHNYKQDENGEWYEARNLRKDGQDSLAKPGSKRFFPIYYDETTKQISSKIKFPIEILPIDTKGQKRIWRKDIEDIDSLAEKKDIFYKKTKDGHQLYFRFRGGADEETPKSLWVEPKFSASEHGTNVLNDILGENDAFSFPKSIFAVEEAIKVSSSGKNDLILDYFAGSGTTGHAVINLNREDEGNRKYILVEMGEYFNTATKPRMQKIIYSNSWKDGKPTTKNGISHIFKYFKTESYEDTLNNLEFKKTEEQQGTLNYYPQAKEDYILNYSLDIESQNSLLNIDTFSSPFDYKLKIATSSVGETKDTTIDLIETFNYLLGLVVKRIEMLKGYLVVEGQNLEGEKILIIWRDGQSNDELNQFFTKMDWSIYDREFDTIYVNGDNNLENLKQADEQFKVILIEKEFQNRMFQKMIK